MNEDLYFLLANHTALRALKRDPERLHVLRRQACRELDRRLTLAARKSAALKATPHT